jgi:hypothetical protein
MASASKMADAVHYVVARTRPDRLGATKLNKVLWFADLNAYRRLGRTITGEVSYRKLQHGPVPNQIGDVIDRLRTEGRIQLRYADTPAGTRKEYVWLQPPDVSSFTPAEVDILNEAMDWVCNRHTAASISALTHDDLWAEVDLGAQIPIGAAAVIEGDPGEDDMAWAVEALQQA